MIVDVYLSECVRAHVCVCVCVHLHIILDIS